MPKPVPESVAEAAEVAAGKAAAMRALPRYLLTSALGGAYIGAAIVLLVSTAGPLAAAGSPATKLVSGAVFGIALTLIVFAGAELFTGNNMIMMMGWLRRRVGPGEALAVNVASLAGNFVGAVAFSALVHGSGVLAAGAKPGQDAAGTGMVGSLAAGKMAAPDAQLFWRAVLCNMLVCLAMWMATRATNDTARLIVLFWGLMAFIASGFEHSVANMTVFGLAIFSGSAHWGDLGHNLLLTVPGNIVGGAVLVALPYVLVGRTSRVSPVPVEKPAPARRTPARATPEPSSA